MIDPASIRSVLFDFDGTLCSSRYFEPLGEQALATIGELLFSPHDTTRLHAWIKGDLTSDDIAAYLSGYLPESKSDIVSALHDGCKNLKFNDAVYNFAKQQPSAHRKTALVTANMDVFSDIVVPAHGLDELFDLILNTADHHTLDKAKLWQKSIDSFGPGHSISTTLLIDNSPAMVEQFHNLGGWAYHYTDDNSFRHWLIENTLA